MCVSAYNECDAFVEGLYKVVVDKSESQGLPPQFSIVRDAV